MQLISIDDIRAAAELIRPYVLRTPLVPAGWADDERPLWIKPENLQSIGAFKVRGAFNAIGHLDESVRTRGVVAYSSGPGTQIPWHIGASAHLVGVNLFGELQSVQHGNGSAMGASQIRSSA